MDIQTVTHVLIRMDEHEADSVLSDPSEFQSALRSVLKNGGGKPAVVEPADGNPAITRRREAPELPKPASARHVGKSICPKCHLLKDNRGYKKHVAACQGVFENH